MIYITGDTHGGFQRFATDHFPQQKRMNRDIGSSEGHGRCSG